MWTGAHVAALIEYDDAVGGDDSGQPMGDNNRRAVLHQAVERTLHQLLAFRIEGTCRLIEQQYFGVAQNGARNGDALALSARQAHAFLTQKSSEAVRLPVEKFGRRRRFGCRADLIVRGVGPAVANILPRIGGKDYRLLGHHADLATQF